jgi:hypothetical protein
VLPHPTYHLVIFQEPSEPYGWEISSCGGFHA